MLTTWAFQVAEVVRDYPFGVEPCGKSAIDALTFVDLLAADGSGLMLVHSGTQYFKRLDDGVIGNLIVRELESHFTGECGFPRVVDFRYTLTPHGRSMSNRDRLRLSAEMDYRLTCVSAKTGSGTLPSGRGFLPADGDGVVSSLRRRPGGVIELRLFE